MGYEADDHELYKALRELASVEVEAVSVRPPAVSHRPTMTAVETAEHGSDTQVIVRLKLGPRGFWGKARGPSNVPAVCRSAAEATLQALESLILSGYAVARVDWLDLAEPRAVGQPAIMHAAVLFRTADQEDLLIGSALVRGVEYEAAVRATLDACNRQVEMLLRATRDE